jgi:hypothetical protein
MKDEKRWTMSVPEMGKRYLNLGRSASYQAAKNGDIPTIRVAGKLLGVVPAMERKLDQVGRRPDEASTS